MMPREHVLIIRFSALGDVAMVVPVVFSLAKAYPDVRFTVLSRKGMRPLFAHIAPNVGFMEADLKNEYRGVKGLNALYRRLAAKQFTAIADLHSVLRSGYLRARFNIERYKVAHIDKHRALRRRLTASGESKLMQPLPTSFQNYADVFARLGYPVTVSFTSIFPDGGGDISLLPPTLTAIDSPSASHKGPWIGVAPFAAHAGKMYPLNLMEVAICQIAERHPGSRIFLFGGGVDEQAVMTAWQTKYTNCVSVPDNIRGLQKELILMSHLDVMLSMDSANMHLASLVNVPVVSVWGATHPFAGFMGWRQDERNAVQLALPCRPCSIFGNRKCRIGDYPCMKNIAPEMIADRIDSVLKAAEHKRQAVRDTEAAAAAARQ